MNKQLIFLISDDEVNKDQSLTVNLPNTGLILHNKIGYYQKRLFDNYIKRLIYVNDNTVKSNRYLHHTLGDRIKLGIKYQTIDIDSIINYFNDLVDDNTLNEYFSEMCSCNSERGLESEVRDNYEQSLSEHEDELEDKLIELREELEEVRTEIGESYDDIDELKERIVNYKRKHNITDENTSRPHKKLIELRQEIEYLEENIEEDKQKEDELLDMIDDNEELDDNQKEEIWETALEETVDKYCGETESSISVLLDNLKYYRRTDKNILLNKYTKVSIDVAKKQSFDTLGALIALKYQDHRHY